MNQWRVPDWFPQISAEMLVQLVIVSRELFRFNEKLNLISEKTAGEADLLHFADSISAFTLIGPLLGSTPVFDIGSGNGFPGIIFAILNPKLQVRLVEKDQRKVEYLKHVISVGGVRNASVLGVSVESLDEGSVPCAVSRGFAPLGKALLLTRKVFEVGGRYFHLKGSQWATE